MTNLPVTTLGQSRLFKCCGAREDLGAQWALSGRPLRFAGCENEALSAQLRSELPSKENPCGGTGEQQEGGGFRNLLDGSGQLIDAGRQAGQDHAAGSGARTGDDEVRPWRGGKPGFLFKSNRNGLPCRILAGDLAGAKAIAGRQWIEFAIEQGIDPAEAGIDGRGGGGGTAEGIGSVHQLADIQIAEVAGVFSGQARGGALRQKRWPDGEHCQSDEDGRSHGWMADEPGSITSPGPSPSIAEFLEMV